MGKSPGYDKNGLKKGPWTAEEDQKLIDYIQKHGYGKWKTLPKNAGLKRCGKSCRLRWTNYLRPDIKRGKFSPDEEETIIQLHKVLGNKWSTIATHLPGRTDNEIKNYWNTHIKKKLLRMGINPVTHNSQLDLLQLSSVLNSSIYGSSYQTRQLNPLSNFLGLGSLLNTDFLNLANNLFFDIQNQNRNQYTGLITSNSEVSNQTQNMDSNLDQFSSTQTNLLFNYQNVLPNYCYGVQNNQNNLSNQNHMYLSTDNMDDNIFKNMSFTSILSSTTPSSSSTPLNSSSTLTNVNGNNEEERDSYCSNYMLFDMSKHSDVINDRFM